MISFAIIFSLTVCPVSKEYNFNIHKELRTHHYSIVRECKTTNLKEIVSHYSNKENLQEVSKTVIKEQNRKTEISKEKPSAQAQQQEPEEIVPSNKENQIRIAEKLVVNFDFDSYVLKDNTKKAIEEFISTKLLKTDKVLYVTGYTCDIGSEKYNDLLAKKRANSVRDFLIKNNVRNPIKTLWKGKCCYLSTRSASRRVEITFEPPEL